MIEPVRALVIEDDRSWQQLLIEMLSDAGLAVDAVDNLPDALATISLRAHRIAVVDLSLAGHDAQNQDGLRVLEALRQRDPGCIPLLLTGFATVELAVNVIKKYGAYTCLRKEAFQRGEFRQVIRQALAQAAQKQAHEEARPPVSSTLLDDHSNAEKARTALIVEDDAGWRSVLAELLQDAGYETRLCAGFGEAMGYLRREQFQLAIVDLSLEHLPSQASEERLPEEELDGYRLLSIVQAAGIPAIVVSGVATAEEIENAYQEQGIFAYLEKQTFNRRNFLQTVQAVQNTGRTQSRQILPSAAEDFSSLTAREREVLDLLARGLTNKEIAEALSITTNTVKRHLKAVFEKLDVHTRSAAAAKAISSQGYIR